MAEGCITVERYLFSYVFSINCDLHDCEMRFKNNRLDLERAIFETFRISTLVHLSFKSKY